VPEGPNYIESSETTGGQRPSGRQSDLVLLCGREDFCSEARHELQRRRKDLRIADVDGLAGARRILGEESPAVILAEERALAVKREHPTSEDASVLSEPKVPYDELIQAMDAIRSAELPAAEALVAGQRATGAQAGAADVRTPQTARVVLFTNIALGDAP